MGIIIYINVLFAGNVSPVVNSTFLFKLGGYKMFKTNDKVLYGSSGICIVEGKMSREFKGKTIEYYVLKPIENMNSTVFVPVSNQDLVSRIKKLLTENEIEDMIKELSDDNLEWINHDNTRRDRFKSIIKSGNRKEIMRLIRTLYTKQLELKEGGRKMHAVDVGILKEAQKILHDEMAYVLDIESDDVAAYILSKVHEVKM